jgi:hypothetical protein
VKNPISDAGDSDDGALYVTIFAYMSGNNDPKKGNWGRMRKGKGRRGEEGWHQVSKSQLRLRV